MSGVGSQVSDRRSRVSGLGSRVSDLRFLASNFGSGVSELPLALLALAEHARLAQRTVHLAYRGFQSHVNIQGGGVEGLGLEVLYETVRTRILPRLSGKTPSTP